MMTINKAPLTADDSLDGDPCAWCGQSMPSLGVGIATHTHGQAFGVAVVKIAGVPSLNRAEYPYCSVWCAARSDE